jgi:hypothetical protein
MRAKRQSESVLVIDEVQKIPDWSEAVKEQWDKDTFENNNIKLVLLGSSQLLLLKGVSESLAGRFELIPIEQWSYSEMNEAFGFSIQDYLWFGGYPGGADLIKDELRWKEYVLNSLIETTLYNDILMMSRINKPALLRRLFELGCVYSGQIVSLNKMIGQLQDAGNTTTLSHYLTLLDNGGLLAGIDKYSLSKIRTRASSPKFQVKDNSLYSVMSGKTREQIMNNPELFGRLVESAVGTHLLHRKREKGINLFYWRDGDLEVDFIIENQEKIICVEVKTSAYKSINGLNEFRKRFCPHKTLLISPEGFNYEEFLKTDPLDLF